MMEKVNKFEEKVNELKDIHDSLFDIADSNLKLEQKMQLYDNKASLFLSEMQASVKKHRTLLKDIGLLFTKTARKMLKCKECANVVNKRLKQ